MAWGVWDGVVGVAKGSTREATLAGHAAGSLGRVPHSQKEHAAMAAVGEVIARWASEPAGPAFPSPPQCRCGPVATDTTAAKSVARRSAARRRNLFLAADGHMGGCCFRDCTTISTVGRNIRAPHCGGYFVPLTVDTGRRRSPSRQHLDTMVLLTIK